MFDNEQQRGRSPKPKVQCPKSFGRGWFTLMPPWAPKRRRDAQPSQVKPSQGRSRLVKVKRPTLFMKMTIPGSTAASVRGRPVSRCLGTARWEAIHRVNRAGPFATRPAVSGVAQATQPAQRVPIPNRDCSISCPVRRLAGRNGSGPSIHPKRSIRKKARQVPVGRANQARRRRRRRAIQSYSGLFEVKIFVPPPNWRAA